MINKLRNITKAIAIKIIKKNNQWVKHVGEMAYHIIIKPNNIIVQVFMHISGLYKIHWEPSLEWYYSTQHA